MIEEGIVQFVTTRLAALEPPVNVPGGFNVQLPPGQITAANPQAWAYRSITSVPGYTLAGYTGWDEWTVQIDSHGNEADDARTLSLAIDQVLRGGFQGLLADPDTTRVFGIYKLPTKVDGYSDANRSYVRMTEFVIQYQQI